VRLVPGPLLAAAPRGGQIGTPSSPDAVRAVRTPRPPTWFREAIRMGSVVKKRRKRMAKKKHRKLLRKTRVQRRRLGK